MDLYREPDAIWNCKMNIAMVRACGKIARRRNCEESV
jgi:hypothetical protein